MASYPFLSRIITVERAMTREEETGVAKIWSGRSSFASQGMTESMETLQYFWKQTYEKVNMIALEERIDFVLADWQDEPAVESLSEKGLPLAIMWPHLPWTMGNPRGPHTGQLLGTLATLVPSLSDSSHSSEGISILQNFATWAQKMRRNTGAGQIRRSLQMPAYISFVNSFCGLEPLVDCSATIETIGPILSDEFPGLSERFEVFLRDHRRIVYISFDDHSWLSAFDLHQIIEGLLLALEKEYIDGVIWATHSIERRDFFDVYDQLLENQNPQWIFCTAVPQRAVLAHSATRVFLSQCETTSLNEAFYHGVPIVAIDGNHSLNSKQAEAAGVARTLSHQKIDAFSICAVIGDIVQDVYGSYQNNVDYMQRLAATNGSRKELAGNMIEEACFLRRPKHCG